MGTWGSGNFESDTALDHLGPQVAAIVDRIAAAMDGDPAELEPDEYAGVTVPCDVELLTVLARAGLFTGRALDPATVAAWKHRYLEVWEATIDGLEPTPAHKAERRAVLRRTFDALAEELPRP